VQIKLIFVNNFYCFEKYINCFKNKMLVGNFKYLILEIKEYLVNLKNQ